MKAIAVIPAQNEEKYIAEVIIKAKKYVDEVIVVNDGSNDNTAKIANEAGAKTLNHKVNLGKASAMKTGCELAIRRNADIIILLDGDGQHNPEKIPEFLSKLSSDNNCDFIFGTRIDKSSMPFVRRMGTQILKYIMKRLFSIKLPDMQCGYRAFRSRVYKLIQWKSKNYHADAEITARVGKNKIKYSEVYIETIYHDPYKGVTILDGIALICRIFIWKFTL